MSEPKSLTITYGESLSGNDEYVATSRDGNKLTGAVSQISDRDAVLALVNRIFDEAAGASTQPPVNFFLDRSRVGIGPEMRRVLLDESIREDKECSITYKDATGSVTTREIEPYRIFTADNGNVLIEAFDLGKNEVRHFRLDRVQQVIL